MFGKREEFVMSFVNLIDNWRRNALFCLQYTLNKKTRNKLKRNKNLENIHKGERCFIIGNGPSLKHYDLQKLNSEIVFTVNFMMRSEFFEALKPNYHVLADPNIFKLDSKNEDDLKKVHLFEKAKDINPDIKFFIPYKWQSFAQLFNDLDFYYFYNNQIFTPRIKHSYVLHRNTPIFQNVIIYAINIALYMGFEKIYLLGVDMTGFLEFFEYNKVNNQWGHIYNISEDEVNKHKKHRIKNKYDNEFYLKAYGKTFEHFKLIRNIASDKNVKLINASGYGALDVIPRVDFEQLFIDTNNEHMDK